MTTNGEWVAEIERLRKLLDMALFDKTQLNELYVKFERKLSRFEDREPKIEAIKQATIEQLPKAVCDLEVWEQENPAPK